MPNPAVGIRLDEDAQNRLKALGKLRNRSSHHLMKEAIEIYLAAQETIEAEKRLTIERWDAFALTGETLDHGNVKAWAAKLSKQ